MRIAHSLALLAPLWLAACSEGASQTRDGALVDIGLGDGAIAPDLSCNADLQSDPANCGACSHSCQGGACAGGLCQPITLVATQNNPLTLAVDDSDVYWITSGTPAGNFADGAVSRAAKADGAGAKVIASGYYDPRTVAVDATNVYWSNQGNAAGAGMKIMILPKSLATPAMQLATAKQPTALAIDATNVYFRAFQPNVIMPGDHPAILSVPILGGSPSELTPPFPAMIGTPAIVRVDDQYVYFNASLSYDPNTCPSNCPPNGISRLPKSGGAPNNLTDPNEVIFGMTLHGSDLYYSAYQTKTQKHDIKRVNKAGGTPVTLVSGVYAHDLIVDDLFVYWADGVGVGTGTATGGIWKVSAAGGTAIPVATSQPGPVAITADAQSLYWINSGTFSGMPYLFIGSVMKLAK